MIANRGRLWLWACILVLSHGLLFAAGYYVSSTRSQVELGDRALSNFIDELAALTYLEKGDVDGVRHMLRVSLDGNLLAAYRYGTPVLDSRRPDAKRKLVLQYNDIRKKYPPIDYGDGGAMNQEVDRALAVLQDSKGQ
jgi:hypothetical protein